MPDHQQHADCEAFLRAAATTPTRTVILTWIDEWGPDVAGRILYDRQRHCRLLAYADGTIHSCDLPDSDRADLAERIRAAGLQVEERSRNLTR